NSSGCTGSDSQAITVDASPTPSIIGNASFCSGTSTILDAGAGYNSYHWSTAATTQTLSVSTTGNYTVTVTGTNGCTGTVSKTETANPNPFPIISGTTSFCSGNSTILSTGSFSSY